MNRDQATREYLQNGGTADQFVDLWPWGKDGNDNVGNCSICRCPVDAIGQGNHLDYCPWAEGAK